MALELQRAVCELVHRIYGGEVIVETPAWLQQPSRSQCGRRWPVVRRIYSELTGLELPEEPPPRERRTVDLILKKRGQAPRIVEVDETQHFNEFRAITLRGYPSSATIAFPKRDWVVACNAKKRLEGGGFAKPRPPLFPGENGRHRQRAFRDALADLVPAVHGWLPTLRIADFEVEDWIFDRRPRARMVSLLASRL
jgi:hypothetical protein